MAISEKLSGALKRLYTIVYREDHLSWGGYLYFKKRLWGIQARKGITKEGLGWRYLDRMSRSGIFTTRF